MGISFKEIGKNCVKAAAMFAVLLVVMLVSGKGCVLAQQVLAVEEEERNMEEKQIGIPKVKGEYGKQKIKLTWKKVKNAEVYRIYRKNAKGEFEQIGETEKLTYSDKKVKWEKTYSYKVAAAYWNGEQLVMGAYSKACKVLASDIDPKKKMVALTFDDGPGPYTTDIVDCLKKNNGRATFFVVGNRVNSNKKAVKQADKAGCEIGSHSFDHANLAKLSQKDIQSQMKKTDERIKKIIGKKAAVMRAPYGETGGSVKRAVGKPIILWSIDTEDWKTRSKEKTISAVMNHVKDGDIVLMHDIHKSTKEAALSIIPRLKSEGYQLVTVSELARYRGYKLKKGTVYRSLHKKK